MALGIFARARRSRSTLLVALLLLTLGLAAVLAHQAYDATRDHRVTAERTLRDYAATAAWEFNAHAKEELWQALAYAFRPCKAIETTSARHALLPPPEILVAEAKKLEACACTLVLDTDYYFLIDFRDGRTTFAGASAPAIGPEWLTDTVTAHASAAYERGWEFATIFHGTGPHARTIVYTLKRDAVAAPVAAYGFVIDPQRFGEAAYTRVMKKWQLLPYALTQGTPNDSLLRLSVLSASGDEIYGSAADFDDAISGSAEWKPFFGGMMTHVSMRPEAAERLVIGGLPRSRLPLLLGVLAHDRRAGRRRRRAAASGSGAGAPAVRLRIERVARAAHAARPDPHVRRDAAPRPGAKRRRADAVDGDHRSGGATARTPGRERAALLARRATVAAAVPRDDATGAAGGRDGRVVRTDRARPARRGATGAGSTRSRYASTGMRCARSSSTCSTTPSSMGRSARP